MVLYLLSRKLIYCFFSFFFISYSSSSKFSTTHSGWSWRGNHCPPKPHAADGSGSDWAPICTDQHPRDPASTNRCPGHPARTHRSTGTSHIGTHYHARNPADANSHSAATATSSGRSETWYRLGSRRECSSDVWAPFMIQLILFPQVLFWLMALLQTP